MASSVYRGRFAPSPSGPLHFGSVVAAVASFADARAHHGSWLVRIEDIDETRCNAHAEAQILQTLDRLGMRSDEPPLRQSGRKPLYEAALRQLAAHGAAYRCQCSRKTIAAVARAGSEGAIYPGTCRQAPPPSDVPVAWRAALDDAVVAFEDRIAGACRQNPGREIGDFVIKRIDGFFAYQLAVVVDDHDQGITDVVRGADLLWSTPRQIWLQRRLGWPQPRYAHVPLVFGADGQKLSKSDNAHPVREDEPLVTLRAAWRHLGQADVPNGIRDTDAFWHWAAAHWDIQRIPHDRPTTDERTYAL